MRGRIVDLQGKSFGRLTVIERGENDSHGTARWVCQCLCGNIKLIRGDKLRNGEVVSCGCYQSECRISDERKRKISQSKIKHGISNTKLYYVYNNMVRRCYDLNNAKYKNYGKRGISVCDEWLNDKNTFFDWALSNGYSVGLTLDRIDVNGNYCPSNCRWVSQKVQANNKTNNITLTYLNETKTISEWAEEIGISSNTLWSRKHNGWSDEKILSTPLQHTAK